jgi:DNA-binding NtrC family response regulator
MHVLVIDGEADSRQLLLSQVRSAGYSADTAASLDEAHARLLRGDVDVALCSINLPEGGSLELVRRFAAGNQAVAQDTQFIMLAEPATLGAAAEALKSGATDYIIKPVLGEELLHRLAQIKAIFGLRAEIRALRNLGPGGQEFYKFSSPSMRQVDRLISQMAANGGTVLITGERGTGKGAAARAIHEQGPRAGFPFIPVNCGAIPENLIESEFFGHVKGAFPGADRVHKGVFTEASRGTIFLDEIDELPLSMQAKLLRAIEDRQIRPLGSDEARATDVRIIAATHCNLAEMVKAGRFREDLYARLGMFHIHIPPLRERRADIGGLIRHLMHGSGSGSPRSVIEIDPEVDDILQSYDWPGNVRQLESVINRVYILSEGERVSLADLPPEITRQNAGREAGALLDAGTGLREQLRRAEAQFISKALEEAGGDRRLAAQRLEIGLSSLYRKLEELSDLGILRGV